MKISLEVLTSVSTKRKRPWSKLAWIGKENGKLLLLGKNNASALSLKTGKTKKNIGKINSVLKTTITTCISSDGVYLAGVLASGNLFVWKKDNDALWTIEGLQNLSFVRGKALSVKISLFVSQSVDVILVVTKLKNVFVWERDYACSLDPKRTCLDGVWSAVIVGNGIPLPNPGVNDAVVGATILNDRILGKTALCSFVFNNGNCICISTVHLQWQPRAQLSEHVRFDFKVHWHSVQYAFNNLGSLCQPLKSVRAYVPCYSKESLLLALAINQKNAFSSRLLFVAPLTRAVLAVDLQGCGARSELSASKKCYQIADLGWTTNDALLAGVTHHGCFFLLSRLGDLLLISTHGCQMDLNYNHFPNLHPLIKVKVGNKGLANDYNSDSQSTTSTLSEKSIAQRFSVTTHPTLPVILCSDGYLVTCLLVPSTAEKSIGVMESLVMNANKVSVSLQKQIGVYKEPFLLQQLYKTATMATQTPNTNQQTRLLAGKQSSMKDVEEQIAKKLEEQIFKVHSESPVISDVDTASSGSSINITDHWSNIQCSSAGKILFGETADGAETVSSPNYMLQQTIQEQDIGKWRNVVSLLVSAWGFAVSNPTLWDDKWEVVTSHTVNSFVQLCRLFVTQRLDNSVELTKSRSIPTHPTHPPIDVPTALLFKCLDLLQFSILHQNLMPAAIALIDGVVCVLVHWCISRPFKARGSLLLEVANVLGKAEAKIISLYSWDSAATGGYLHISGMWHPDVYHRSLHQFKSSGPFPKSDFREHNSSHVEGICKRFTKAWNRVYNAVVSYWHQVQKHEFSEKEYELSKAILIHVQENLQKRDMLHHRKRGRVKEGTFLCLRGCYDEAVIMWNKEKHSLLSGMESSSHLQKKLSHCLHSILYTLLQNCEFSAALQFINTLLLGNFKDNEAIPLAICVANQGSAVMNSVLSMARFLARYFTCSHLFIYPPYKPKVMPSVLDEVDRAKGCMLMSRELVQAVVVGEELSSTWTPEAALSLLLLSGAFAEAAGFTFAVGDWKMAFLLAVVCAELEKEHSSVNKRVSSTKLPLVLQPVEIMATKLTTLLGLKKQHSAFTPRSSADVTTPKRSSKFSKHTTRDNSYFFANRMQVLTDHMTAGVLSGIDIVPGLIKDGISQLELLIKELPFGVPGNYYLPAPPFYCLQDDGEPVCTASHREIVSRAEISSTIQLILDIYKSSRTLLPIAFSYTKHLADLQEGKDLTAMKKCTNILESFDQYQDCSTKIPMLPGNKPDVALVDLQGFFRCLCCFVWLLHCRDEMELATRKLWKKLETTLPFSTNGKRGKLGLSALHWARRLSPFVKFMEWEWDFYQNVLTLVSESSSTVEVSNLFAACIPDLSVLPSQMESRVQLLMNQWQTVNVKIASPAEEEDILQQPFKIMWLSDYHYRFSRKYQDLPSNVQHHFGGVPNNEENWSKHWPFETDPEFLEFITVFFDVIIHKSAEEYILKSQIPLLHVCMHDILEKELLFMAHDVVATVQKKQLLSFSSNTKLKDLASQKLASGAHVITRKNSKRQKRLGLFHTNNVKSPTTCKSLREGGSSSITICPTYTHHSTASSSPMPYVRRTRSVTYIKQQHYPKDSKLKPCRVSQKGNNCSLNWGQVLNLCTSSIADSCNILSHIANHTDPMVDINGALYKSSHLILWLYRWANRASLQLQENIGDDPSFSRPQIRVQIPVDHILAAMTIFKKKSAYHEAVHTANNHETSLNVIQDVMVEPPSNSAKPSVVNCDLKPLTGKRNSNYSLVKSKSEDFAVSSRHYEKPSEHSVTVAEENLKVRRSDSVDDLHKIQRHKLDELHCLRHGESLRSSVAVQTTNTVIPLHGIAEHKPMITFDHEHQQASKTVLHPSEKPTSKIKLKKSPAVQHPELRSEVQQVVEAQHDEQMEIVNLMSRKNHDAHSTDVCLQSSLSKLLPNINIKKSNTSKMEKTESPEKVSKNSKQAADKVTITKLLPCIPKCKTSINLSNSKCSLSISQHSSKSQLVRSPAGLLNSSVDLDDNTLDDVTSPDSIQMSPPLENRGNIVLKSKKNTVRFAEKVDLQRNSLGFRLLTVDASYLSPAWQDKVAHTMGKSHLCDGRLKKKLSREVPHFLRLKAERDNDDSSSQDVDSNSVSRENNQEYCDIADDGKTADDERLRGGGSRRKPPFPLFTMPPVPLVSPSTPLQMPNSFQLHSTLPHRGYPLLHLPQKYQEKAQTIKQNEPCHVCNQDLSCDDSLYVQGRLRQYWQDIQQASFCPATIADPFAPVHPASHPLVPVPLTAPCCPYIPPAWSSGIPYYRHGSSLAQYRLSPYSVIPPSYAVQSIRPQVNVAVESHCRPRAYSETSLLPSGTNVVSQQNVSSNKVASLSSVPSSASTQNENILSEGNIRTGGQCKKSRTLHEVSAALSVSAPNIIGISSVCGPTSDIAVSDGPSLGLVGTTTTTHNPPSVVTMTPAQYLILETDAILPKTSTKAGDAHSMISHGEVRSMQSHNYVSLTQTNNTNGKHKELVESHSPTLASTKIVSMMEPKSILHIRRDFSKEMPLSSPTRSTLNGPPATLLSDDQFDAHQRSSPTRSTLLSPECTGKNLSSVPMNRVEFAESHFQAVHELEKAKKLLTDLYRSKQAANKEVQTDADLAGQENSSNRQTSGQDITAVAYTSHSKLNNIPSTNTEDLIDLPSFKIPRNASWSTSIQAAQPALNYNHQTSVAESHNSSQVPQPLQFEQEEKSNRSPLLLLPDVEEAFPQLMNVSARASDPPTEELPRKLAMGTVQRRLQNINDHIKVMEKMSFDLETDFQDSKKLLRNLDVGRMERDIDSLPSAYLLSTTNSGDTVPVNCFQFRFNDFNLPSGKDKQTTFKPSSTNYRNRVKIPRSRSLSPPSSSSKSISSRGDKDQHSTYNKCRSSSPSGTTHDAVTGSQEASPRRLMKFGSFQQLLLGDKADSFQDVVSSEISSVSHQDRALARQVQKDAHFKLRMQEACQLMDEIVAAEPTRNSSSLSSSTSSPHFGVGKGKQKNIVNVQNLFSSRRKQTTAHCGEICKCCSAEKRQNQNILHDFDMEDSMMYLNSLKFRISENKEVDRSQESLGRVIAGHANRKAEGPSASRQNGHENADLKPYPSERVRNKSGSSDRINSAYTLPAVKNITAFGRTYSVGQPITVASTIAEVSDETEPTSKCIKARVPEQRHHPISKTKMMKNKAPRKKLAVRMTRAVLLRKKLSKAKESHGTKSRPNVGSSNSCRQQVKHLPCTSTAVKRGQNVQQPERRSTMQTKPVAISSAKPEVNFSCATSSWEVPGDIRSTTNSTDADQTTDDFSYNGFEEDFLTDED